MQSLQCQSALLQNKGLSGTDIPRSRYKVLGQLLRQAEQGQPFRPLQQRDLTAAPQQAAPGPVLVVPRPAQQALAQRAPRQRAAPRQAAQQAAPQTAPQAAPQAAQQAARASAPEAAAAAAPQAVPRAAPQVVHADHPARAVQRNCLCRVWCDKQDMAKLDSLPGQVTHFDLCQSCLLGVSTFQSSLTYAMTAANTAGLGRLVCSAS